MISVPLYHQWPGSFAHHLFVQNWAYNACRLIAINKCPGVRPIGICKVVCRIIRKAVLSILKPDIQSVTGSLQLCTGQIAGIEAAIHAMNDLFHSEDTEAIVFIDASNVFNSLNKQAALRNFQSSALS